MSLTIESFKPEYGKNYKKGYIGFAYYNTSIVSMGITYLTRWARMSDIKVSHTLLVTGENECVEAHLQNSNAAAKQVGTKYEIDLIATHAIQGTFLGKLINNIFDGKPDRLVNKLLNRDDRWICSELVAHCLNEKPEYHNKGILTHPDETIDPQELFEDPVIFEPWKYKA